MSKPISFDVQLLSSKEGGEYVLIDARLTEEISCGFLATETVNDIFALRDAIDEFITKHQISRIINE